MTHCSGLHARPEPQRRSSADVCAAHRNSRSLTAVITCIATLLLPAVSGGDEASDRGVARSASAAEVRATAQLLEAARHASKATESPLDALARALRSTRRALSDVASPRGEDGPAETATALALRAAELRLRCNAIPAVGEQTRSLARLAGELTSRCARLLTAVDEVVALPDARARSERAAAVLGDLAAAGPPNLDPLRAPHEPTMRVAE